MARANSGCDFISRVVIGRGFLVSFLVFAIHLVTSTAAATEKGQMGELFFTLAKAYANPFDVNLKATFVQGSTSYGFWGFYSGAPGGVSTWKVRYNLPATGSWSYTTTSSDGPLNGKSGTVTVTAGSSANRGVLVARGRALAWENTGEPYFIMGQTAYTVLQKTIPWMTVMDWLQQNGFNQIRMDLTLEDPASGGQDDMWLWGGSPNSPDFSRFNLAQWDKVDQVLAEGLRRGFTFELGTKTIQQLPVAGSNRTRYLRYLAARLGSYPHLIYLESYELGSAVRGGIRPTPDDVKALGADFAAAFQASPRKPLLGLHLVRNFTYHQGNTGSTYYHTSTAAVTPWGGTYDFRGQAWLTCGIFHERWKMEGFGVLQHRPYFVMPLYTGETVYELTNGRLGNSRTADLDAFGIAGEILTNPRFFYRRYTYGIILSGGVGLTYGLDGDSAYTDNLGNHVRRFMTGLPSSRAGLNGAEGYKDIKKALDYFRAKHLDVTQLVPDDTRINNGYSTSSMDALSRNLGLKRAKFARISGKDEYFAYNPYSTNLTITGIPAGLSIEIFSPQTGNTYFGGTTTGGSTFRKPTQFRGDYLLYIRGTGNGTPGPAEQ